MVSVPLVITVFEIVLVFAVSVSKIDGFGVLINFAMRYIKNIMMQPKKIKLIIFSMLLRKKEAYFSQLLQLSSSLFDDSFC
jgi:hypothetical protein